LTSFKIVDFSAFFTPTLKGEKLKNQLVPPSGGFRVNRENKFNIRNGNGFL